ncbi:MAG TPA: serine acetyltransferase, partial [Chromatiales bacterium]|nr:serine acetyltransferase [Chromatiales bacterium]
MNEGTSMDAARDNPTDAVIEALLATYQDDSGANFIDVRNLPVRGRILQILDMFYELLFPGYSGSRVLTRQNLRYIIGDLICQVRCELSEQIRLALRHRCRLENCSTQGCEEMAARVTEDLLGRLPAIRELLKGDVEAAYLGDPAARSFEEIVISYPCILAIATHRIAHELYLADIPLIPRLMSERAHSLTGIDIHPGARIGRNFFIDHGTGVVIGETCIIGDNVKIYQGVTLGALSFPRDERGRIVKGGKRHPTIENDVTIYAEATI